MPSPPIHRLGHGQRTHGHGHTPSSQPRCLFSVSARGSPLSADNLQYVEGAVQRDMSKRVRSRVKVAQSRDHRWDPDLFEKREGHRRVPRGAEGPRWTTDSAANVAVTLCSGLPDLSAFASLTHQPPSVPRVLQHVRGARSNLPLSIEQRAPSQLSRKQQSKGDDSCFAPRDKATSQAGRVPEPRLSVRRRNCLGQRSLQPIATSARL